MTAPDDLRLLIEHLQDALLKVEWVRSHDHTWRCAFCGGQSEEEGGDGHRDGCDWQRLVGWHEPSDAPTPSTITPEQAARGHFDDDDLRECRTCGHHKRNHVAGRCRKHRCGCGGWS